MARRLIVGVVLAVAAMSTACSSTAADKSGAAATVRTEPPTTTTTDPKAVPATIDAIYVNRVLADLDAVMGDVTRQIVRSRTIPRESYDRMRAVFGSDGSLQLQIDVFQRDLLRGLVGYGAEPGNQVSTVVELITASQACIFARISRDYSAVAPGGTATSDRNWVVLVPLDPARDTHGYNPTMWSLTYDGFPPDRSQPPNRCSTSS